MIRACQCFFVNLREENDGKVISKRSKAQNGAWKGICYWKTSKFQFDRQAWASASACLTVRVAAQSPWKFKFTNKLSHCLEIEHKSPPTPNSPTPQGPVKGRLKAQFQCILLTVKG